MPRVFRSVFFYFILLYSPAFLPAQGNAGPPQHRPLAAEQWQKAADGLDYSKDVPKPPKPVKKDPPAETPRPRPVSSPFNWGEFSAFWGNFFQVLAILIILSALAYVLYRMFSQPADRRIASDGTRITLDNLDAYLHETDLQRFLREALAQNNYALAIRLYFLQTIKDLSQTGAIGWSKEKTNRDYLLEMQQHALAAPFQLATRRYEYIWYGNTELTRSDFDRLEPEFKALLDRIVPTGNTP